MLHRHIYSIDYEARFQIRNTFDLPIILEIAQILILTLNAACFVGPTVTQLPSIAVFFWKVH